MENDVLYLTELDTEEVSQDSLFSSSITDDPHWCIPSKELDVFCKMASKFGWRSGRDLTAKSVLLQVSEDKTTLLCRATDFDSYLLYKIPLINPSPATISSPIIFQTSVLANLIKLCPNQVILSQKGESNPMVYIMGAWIEVETTILDPSVYTNSDPVSEKKEVSYFKELPSLSSLASKAVLPRDRVITFTPTYIQSTHFWSTLQASISSPLSFTLISREADLIASLCAGSSSIFLGVTTSDMPRICIESSHGTLWLLYRSEGNVEPIPEEQPMIKMNLSQLNNIVRVSKLLPNSSGLIELQFTDSFIVTYKSNLQSTAFPLSFDVLSEPKHLQSSLIQTKILEEVLKPFGNESVLLSWNETTLFISSDTIKVSIRFES